MLARASQRDREIAIRAAVGASGRRLVRQLLTESLALSSLGGLAGVIVSLWVVDLFIKLSPGDIPRLNEASADFRLFGFALLVSVLTGIGFGLLPAFHAVRTNLNDALKDGTKGSEGRQRRRSRNVLVVTEVALAQVLLVGAALLAISYVRVAQVNPGFNPDRVLSAKIAPVSDIRIRKPEALSIQPCSKTWASSRVWSLPRWS
jgi:predicted lysophospholipase L1 biosynthesis ABC-type transport system permease subunit